MNVDPIKEGAYPAGGDEPTMYKTPIPPPPPNEWRPNPYDPYAQQKRPLWYYVLIAFLLCVIAGSVLIIWLRFNADTAHIPTTATAMPTTVPTTGKTDYTASDILLDLNKAGVRTENVSYNISVDDWSGGNYRTTYPSTSSITFTVGCKSGYCEPSNLGLWVFATPQAAQQTYNEVQADALAATPTGPTAYTPYGYVHGRCLLLGGDKTSVYGQVVTTYCV